MDESQVKDLIKFVLNLGLNKLGVTVTEELMDRTLDYLTPKVQERIAEFRDVRVKVVD